MRTLLLAWLSCNVLFLLIRVVSSWRWAPKPSKPAVARTLVIVPKQSLMATVSRN